MDELNRTEEAGTEPPDALREPDTPPDVDPAETKREGTSDEAVEAAHEGPLNVTHVEDRLAESPAESPGADNAGEPPSPEMPETGTVPGVSGSEPVAVVAESGSADDAREPAEANEPTGVSDSDASQAADTVEAEELIEDEWLSQRETVADQEAIDLRALVEAIIYITEEPVTPQQIAAAIQRPLDQIRKALAEVSAEFEKPEHGMTVREIAGGYKMATKPEHHEAVRAFVKSLKPPLKLSLAALETLAVIAYKQPITTPEIMDIRGVQGAGVLKTLLDRKLIVAAGRKNVIGKPVLYKTTRDFLVQFGLKDLAELPTLKEFEEIRRMSIPDSESAQPASDASGSDAPPAPDPEPQVTDTAPPATEATASPGEEEQDSREAANALASERSEPIAAGTSGPEAAETSETPDASEPDIPQMSEPDGSSATSEPDPGPPEPEEEK